MARRSVMHGTQTLGVTVTQDDPVQANGYRVKIPCRCVEPGRSSSDPLIFVQFSTTIVDGCHWDAWRLFGLCMTVQCSAVEYVGVVPLTSGMSMVTFRFECEARGWGTNSTLHCTGYELLH